MKRCENCYNWEAHNENPLFGLCRAYAPTATIVPQEAGRKYQIVWPSTGKDDWCGDFAPVNVNPQVVQ